MNHRGTPYPSNGSPKGSLSHKMCVNSASPRSSDATSTTLESIHPPSPPKNASIHLEQSPEPAHLLDGLHGSGEIRPQPSQQTFQLPYGTFDGELARRGGRQGDDLRSLREGCDVCMAIVRLMHAAYHTAMATLCPGEFE